jgi:hypothetical protein
MAHAGTKDEQICANQQFATSNREQCPLCLMSPLCICGETGKGESAKCISVNRRGKIKMRQNRITLAYRTNKCRQRRRIKWTRRTRTRACIDARRPTPRARPSATSVSKCNVSCGAQYRRLKSMSVHLNHNQKCGRKQLTCLHDLLYRSRYNHPLSQQTRRQTQVSGHDNYICSTYSSSRVSVLSVMLCASVCDSACDRIFRAPMNKSFTLCCPLCLQTSFSPSGQLCATLGLNL